MLPNATPKAHLEYIAVRVMGFPKFIWFERKHTKQRDGYFFGRKGNGEDGWLTNLVCPLADIEARIESEFPQY